MINHRVKHLLFVGIALTIFVLLLSLAGCTPSFEGNSVKNAYCYELDIEAMNGTDLHTLELKMGDTLQIQFETEKGSLYMDIKAPDGTAVYMGNGRETTEFTLNVPMDGIYPIVVEGQKAKGRIRVDVEKAPEPFWNKSPHSGLYKHPPKACPAEDTKNAGCHCSTSFSACCQCMLISFLGKKDKMSDFHKKSWKIELHFSLFFV